MRKTAGSRTKRPGWAWLLILLILAASHAATARDLIVRSTADSDSGTLRWALETARAGDTITFDPAVFPPSDPETVTLRNPLPPLICGSLTIDASDAGVILSGRLLREGEFNALEIVSSSNTVRGLQILDFSGCGILIAGSARNNTIGGERSIGRGPFGQGNAVGRCNGGVGIWGSHATGNSVIGNAIGTDRSGGLDLGNVDGIALGDGATRNTIGPGNVIAHNRETGVLILSRGTSRNTITRNSIFENGWTGIRFEDAHPGATEITLQDASIQAGLLSGHSCPECEVEFFSDSGSQGRSFIASTMADEHGCYTLSTDSPVVGPAVTATATDPHGTTGPFLILAHVLDDSEALQQDNPHVARSVMARTSDQLEDNRLAQLASLASDVHSREDADSFVKQHLELGLTWYRISLDWLDWCEVVESPRFSSTDIDPNADVAITMLHEKGVDVMLDLVYWDERASIAKPREQLYTTAAEIDRFVNYARTIARHFRGRVASYAVLNEPNVPDPGQFVTPDDYVELVRCTAPAIREEDPSSRIVIGEVTPLWGCDGLDYLHKIMSSDVLPMVDGIAWHWGGASPEFHADFYYGYPELVRDIRSIAEERGFKGELFAEEITLRTAKTPHPSEYMGYEEIPALKYTLRVALMNLGLDLAAGLNFENLEGIPLQKRMTQTLCAAMAGHEAIDLPVAIDIDTEDPVAYCAFRNPNGDRMLAIWTDGIAQDEDPGIPATISFPALAAGFVTGIDVLHGFEQELVFEIDDGSTIVRDVLVKDYPILIQLSDITFGPDYEETIGDGFHRLGERDGN